MTGILPSGYVDTVQWKAEHLLLVFGTGSVWKILIILVRTGVLLSVLKFKAG